MPGDLTKDVSIHRMISRLRSRCGHEAFDVVDKWDADLFAIGIARPDNHHVLVYVCTYGKPADNYFVSLELPPESGSDLPYRNAGEIEVHHFDELVDVIQIHFANA